MNKKLTVLQTTFDCQSLGLDMWVCDLGNRKLYVSPSDTLFLSNIPTSKKLFFCAYLVADEDFDVLWKEHLLLLKQKEFTFNYLPLNTPPLYYKPLEIRLAGQSISDFLTLLRLEQYEGLAGLGQTFARHVENFLKKILPEESDEYELEWKLKDVLHAFTSPLLHLVLKEMKETQDDQGSFQIEKKLIKLKLELEGFLKHQKMAMDLLVESLKHTNEKNTDFYHLTLCYDALYKEIMDNSAPQSWVKITLLISFIEAFNGFDAWVTYPHARRFLGPFLLKIAFEAIWNKFPKEQICEAILNFKQENPVVSTLQQAFYQLAVSFSKGTQGTEEEQAVYDQDMLSLLPPSFLIRHDQRDMRPTKEGEQLLNF